MNERPASPQAQTVFCLCGGGHWRQAALYQLYDLERSKEVPSLFSYLKMTSGE